MWFGSDMTRKNWHRILATRQRPDATNPTGLRFRPIFGHGLLGAVVQTGFTNGLTALIAAVSGVAVARFLGPEQRGDYTAVVVTFALGQAVFELGMGYSLIQIFARHTVALEPTLRAARTILRVLGVLGATFMLVMSQLPMMRSGSRSTALEILAIALFLIILAAAPTALVHARNIIYWNVVRLAQPTLTLLGFLVVGFAGRLNIVTAAEILAVGVAAQYFLASRLAHRTADGAGHGKGTALKTMLANGARNYSSILPALVTARLDQFVLAAAVPSRELGYYSIAVSTSLLLSPVLAAIGNVVLPRVATRSDARSLIRGSLVAGGVLSALSTLVLLLLGRQIIDLVYGTPYLSAWPLLAILAPGAGFLMTKQIGTDLLRGMDQLAYLALVESVSAILTVVGLFVAVPRYGAMGAAVTSTSVYALSTIAVIWGVLRHRSTIRAIAPKHV